MPEGEAVGDRETSSCAWEEGEVEIEVREEGEVNSAGGHAGSRQNSVEESQQLALMNLTQVQRAVGEEGGEEL